MIFNVATWNINSIKVRLDDVINWCLSNPIDLIALQETKSTDENFPKDILLEAGFESVHFGQKQYNGVAILSKHRLSDVEMGLYGDDSEQRRYIACCINGIRIINVYVPNGESLDSEKFPYKLEWLEKLQVKVKESLDQYEHVLVMGDFNIAPTDQDVYDPIKWQDRILVSPKEREAFNEILDLGMQDLYRAKNPDSKNYSWWNYRTFAYKKNHGLRIDHILCSNDLINKCTDCFIDEEPRKQERPSDHTVVTAVFDL